MDKIRIPEFPTEDTHLRYGVTKEGLMLIQFNKAKRKNAIDMKMCRKLG